MDRSSLLRLFVGRSPPSRKCPVRRSRKISRSRLEAVPDCGSDAAIHRHLGRFAGGHAGRIDLARPCRALIVNSMQGPRTAEQNCAADEIMRIFTIILLAINLVTFAWLLVGAGMELPPWEQSFKDTKSTLNGFEEQGVESKAAMAVVRVHLETTEAWTKMAMNEYKRSDLPLGALTICNIVGLSILALKGRRAEPVVPSDGHKPSCRGSSTDPTSPADAH